MKFSKYFDHTILNPDATGKEVELICQEALQEDFASVCVNSYRTSQVAKLLKDSSVKVCTVVGFPLGAQSGESKAYEAKLAIEDGSHEIDMVINIGAVKDGDWESVRKDIELVRQACKDVFLKLIIETCLLTDEEKEKAIEIALDLKVDYIKTSTGFSKDGAKEEDILLIKKLVGNKAKIKASAGIRDYSKAQKMIDAGADRLGTSATMQIISEYQN